MIALWLFVAVTAASITPKLHRPFSNEQSLLVGCTQECSVEEAPWTHHDPESHGSDRQDARPNKVKTPRIRK
jgi:hypothetical protein